MLPTVDSGRSGETIEQPDESQPAPTEEQTAPKPAKIEEERRTEVVPDKKLDRDAGDVTGDSGPEGIVDSETKRDTSTDPRKSKTSRNQLWAASLACNCAHPSF